MRIFYLISLLLLLSPIRLAAQVQLIPADSVGLIDFLMLQEEVPGMSYRFKVPPGQDSRVVLDLPNLSFAETDSGFYSKSFENWTWLPDLENEIKQLQMEADLDILIFSNPSNLEACRTYLASIIRNGDYDPVLETKKPKTDLVALAYRDPYEPFQKFKLLFISDYKLFIVTSIILFFFLTSTGLALFMVVLKIQKSQRDSLIQKYDQELLEPLTSIPFEKELDEIQQMSIQELHEYFPKALLQKSLYQEVLADRIIALNKKMKGDFKLKLKTLYVKLGLDKMTIKLLKEKRWDKITLGLVQVNEMDIVEALPMVKSLTNHGNFQVRSQAVATLLNLSSMADLTFLSDQEFPLSDWQQMNYLRIIKFVSNLKPINLEVLFDSANQSVRLFGYKLVRMLGRYDLLEKLALRAPSANDEEKIEILQTYKSLGAHMEVDFVNDCLKSSTREVQVAAMHASASLGDDTSKDLIVKFLSNEQSSLKLKKAALTALYELDLAEFESCISQNPDPHIEALGRHLTDPLLKNV